MSIPVPKEAALTTILSLAEGCRTTPVASLPRLGPGRRDATPVELSSQPLGELNHRRRALHNTRKKNVAKQAELFNKKKTIKAKYDKAAYSLITLREQLLEVTGSSQNVDKQLSAIEDQIEAYDHAIHVVTTQPIPEAEVRPAPPVGVPQAEVPPAEVAVVDMSDRPVNGPQTVQEWVAGQGASLFEESQAEVQPAEVPVGDHGNDVAIANVPFVGLYPGQAFPPRD